MAQSNSKDSTQKGSKGTRLPSVVPRKVQQSILENEQLAVANDFFASLDPDQIVDASKDAAASVKPLKSAERISESNFSAQGTARPSTAVVNEEQDVVAELDAPLEKIWDDTLNEALGSELQHGLPTPVARKRTAARAIPMAKRVRRAERPGIQIREREDEPFLWRDLFTRKGLKKNSSFLVSLLLHTLLLLFLSLLVVRGGIGDTALFLGAALAPDAPDEEMLEDIIVNPVVFDNMVVDVPTEDLQDEILQQENAEKEALKIDNFESSLLDGQGNNQQAVGDGKSATFFGTKAAGNRFVFVVDRSTSMEYGSKNFPSRELFNRYDVAKSELLRAIESLQPHQEFFVVMFAHNTVPMFGERSIEETKEENFEMIAATPKNKRRFQTWLEDVKMGPGTDPRLALEIAIGMKPDSIFMLSDGAFVSEMNDNREKTKDIINRHVSAGSIVPINTTSLVVRGTIPTMRSIADRSKGKFQFTTIKDYMKKVSQLRGPMRSLALEQLIKTAESWEERERLITERIFPMLAEPTAVERANGESLLHLATMGLFARQVPPVLREGSDALSHWAEIVDEIDGYHRTGQVSALGQGRELEEKLLLSMIELKDESFLQLFDKLDMDEVSTVTMLAMVDGIDRSHLEFGTSPESIGWLRELIARLSGKKPKERSQLARVGWNTEQAMTAIDRLFEHRSKRAKAMYSKYTDPNTGLHLRDRMGKALVKKYPETKVAGRVRRELAREKADTVSVADGDDEDDEPDDPFVQ